MEHLYAERADAQSRLDDLAELIADGTLTAQAVRDAAKPLRATIKRIDEKTAAVEVAAVIPLDLLTGDVPSKWAALSLTGKRAAIRFLLDVRISRQGNTRVFDPDAVIIEWLS